MSTIVKLVQGSAEWHAHRAMYRNASETPIVLGLSPWTTPHQLWQVLEWLEQAPPPELAAAPVHEIWAWAIPNWRPERLAGRRERRLAAPPAG